MYEDQKAKIERIIETGYEFRFGDYFGRGFDILQKNFGGFILFTFLSFIIMGVVALIPLLGIFAVILLLSPAFSAGIYLVADKVWRNEPTEFGDFFKGFDYAGQLVLVSLVIFLFSQLLAIPYYMVNIEFYNWYIEVVRVMMEDPESVQELMADPPQPAFWTYLLMLPTIYIAVSYNWAILFVIFHKMSFWDALEASRRMISKQFFIILLFFIVIGLIGGVGVLLCCIGFCVTYPAYLCMNYAAFEDVSQLNVDPDENDNLEQHLIV